MATIVLHGNICYPKRFELICFVPNGTQSVVIRKKSKKGYHKISMFPYQKQETKFAQFIWWQLLKLCAYLRII
jgi:hypothetical protein